MSSDAAISPTKTPCSDVGRIFPVESCPFSVHFNPIDSFMEGGDETRSADIKSEHSERRRDFSAKKSSSLSLSHHGASHPSFTQTQTQTHQSASSQTQTSPSSPCAACEQRSSLKCLSQSDTHYYNHLPSPVSIETQTPSCFPMEPQIPIHLPTGIQSHKLISSQTQTSPFSCPQSETFSSLPTQNQTSPYFSMATQNVTPFPTKTQTHQSVTSSQSQTSPTSCPQSETASSRSTQTLALSTSLAHTQTSPSTSPQGQTHHSIYSHTHTSIYPHTHTKALTSTSHKVTDSNDKRLHLSLHLEGRQPLPSTSQVGSNSCRDSHLLSLTDDDDDDEDDSHDEDVQSPDSNLKSFSPSHWPNNEFEELVKNGDLDKRKVPLKPILKNGWLSNGLKTPDLGGVTLPIDASDQRIVEVKDDQSKMAADQRDSPQSFVVFIPLERDRKTSKKHVAQLVAMSGCGFILVIFIVAWVLSPTFM